MTSGERRKGMGVGVAGAFVGGMTAWVVVSLLGSPVTPKIHGALNPAVTQSTINDTICVPGYTSRIRPSYAWSSSFKFALTEKQDVSPHDYELDHLIPLELGGAPKASRNLWLEPWAEAHKSDPLENELRAEVCRGEISLAWAQHHILDFKERHG